MPPAASVPSTFDQLKPFFPESFRVTTALDNACPKRFLEGPEPSRKYRGSSRSSERKANVLMNWLVAKSAYEAPRRFPYPPAPWPYAGKSLVACDMAACKPMPKNIKGSV